MTDLTQKLIGRRKLKAHEIFLLRFWKTRNTQEPKKTLFLHIIIIALLRRSGEWDERQLKNKSSLVVQTKVNVKMPEKRLARGVPSLEKSTLSMTKHPEHRRSENCLVSGRGFIIRMILVQLFCKTLISLIYSNAWFYLLLVLVFHLYLIIFGIKLHITIISYLYIDALVFHI